MVGRKTKRKNAQEKHNDKYKKGERAIRAVVFKLLQRHRGRITMRQLEKETGLSRRAIYNHHANVNAVIMESEDALLAEFDAGLDEQTARLAALTPDYNGRIFYAMLIFMSRHREVFCPICSDVNNQGLLHRMVEAAYPRLRLNWLPKGEPAPAIGSERVDLLLWMLTALAAKWGAVTRCDADQVIHYVRRMVRVTELAVRNGLG